MLGESVLAVAAGTAGMDWAPAGVLIAVAGFVAAACIWWLYFDHVGSSGIELGPRPAFYWGWPLRRLRRHRRIRRRRPACHRDRRTEYALAAGASLAGDYGLGRGRCWLVASGFSCSASPSSTG